VIEEEKAQLWLQVFGVTPHLSSVFRLPETPGLMGITQGPKWDTFNAKPHARAIGKQQWQDAFELAVKLDEVVPWLPVPVIGANPLGHITLTYATKDERVLDLELHADLTKAPYRWTMTVDGNRRADSCGLATGQKGAVVPNIRPLIESLRATFGESCADRASRKTADTEVQELA